MEINDNQHDEQGELFPEWEVENRHTIRKADAVLVVGIACGRRIAWLAKEHHVSQPLIRRRLQEPAFQNAVKDARNQIVDQMVGRLCHTMEKARLKLVKLLDSDDAKIQLAAARSLLEFAIALREHASFSERIEFLERKLLGAIENPPEPTGKAIVGPKVITLPPGVSVPPPTAEKTDSGSGCVKSHS